MFILHGSNIVASREALVSEKGRGREKRMEIVCLVGKELTLTELKQALESASLFGSDRLVVIENFFSIPKSKRKDEILDYLKKGDFKTEVIVWEGKLIDGRVLRAFSKNFRIQAFKLPAVIFKFLDSLQPGEPKLVIDLLHQTLRVQPAELVFYMLARRTKELLIAKDLGKKGLSGRAPWQQGRLVYQAERFSLVQLLKLHRSLLKIDWQQKTGRAALPLKSTLDLLILDL